MILTFLIGISAFPHSALATEAVEADDVKKVEAETIEIENGIIKGKLWVDTNENGIMDKGEAVIADYPVALYEANDKNNPIQTMETNLEGEYEFSGLKKGKYVVGIKAETFGDNKYLLPFIHTGNENKFRNWHEQSKETTISTSDVINISGGETIEKVDAGVRMPPKATTRTDFKGSVTDHLKIVNTKDQPVANVRMNMYSWFGPLKSNTVPRISSDGAVYYTDSKGTVQRNDLYKIDSGLGIVEITYALGIDKKYGVKLVDVVTTDTITQVGRVSLNFHNGSQKDVELNEDENIFPLYEIDYRMDLNAIIWVGRNQISAHDEDTIKIKFTSENNFQVEFDSQGSSTGSKSFIKTGTEKIGTIATPTKAGYTFEGWWTAESGGSKVTGQETPLTLDENLQPSETVTLYARWAATTNSIVFDSQGGSSTPGAISRESDEAIGTLATPTKAGYTFEGWWTATTGGTMATATSTSLQLKSDIADGESLKLYARWKENRHTVIFDTQGGNQSSTNINRFATQALGTLPIATKDNYDFQGWWTTSSQSGGTMASQMSTPIGLKSQLQDNDAMTLYARWTPKNYNIQVKYETRTGGSITGASDFNVSKPYNTIYTVPAASTNIDKYILVDWKLNGIPQGNTNPSTVVQNTSTNIVLVYGQDSDNNGTEDVTFAVKHEDQLGNGIGVDRNVTLDVGATFNDGAPLITGYTYANSYVDQNGNTKSGKPNFNVGLTDAGKTIKYKYDINSNNVKVNVIDRQGSSITGYDSVTTPVVFGESFSPATPTIEDYKFVDWKIGASGSLKGNTSPSVAAMPDEDVELYLIYGQDKNNNGKEDVTITVKHLNQLDEKVFDEEEKYIDLGDNFSMEAISDSAYTFVSHSWNGGATSTAKTATMNNITADQELIFRYDLNNYQVKVSYEYHDNQGNETVLPGEQIANVDHGDTLTLDKPVFENKALVGWKVGNVDMGTAPDDIVVTAASNITFIYKQDMDGDGLHDYTMTEESKEAETGTVLKTTTSYVTESTNYNKTPEEFTGYDYIGFSVDGGPMQIANATHPTINSVGNDHKIEILYGKKAYDVKVKYIDEKGKSIKKESVQELKHGENFQVSIANISGYSFSKWMVNNVDQKGKDVKIDNIDKNSTISLVYKSTNNNDGKDNNGGNGNNKDNNGYDKNGYDKNGYDKNGYDKNGYDKNGQHMNAAGKIKTGDESNMMLWVSLVLIILALGTGVLVFRKRHN